MSAALPILISGGGVGGLAAALAIANAGFEVRLFERQLRGHASAGAGIQLGPNAVKMLRNLGVADAVQAAASTPSQLVVRHGMTGKTITRMPLGEVIALRHGAPYWVLHRADLHAALATAIAQHPRIQLTEGNGVRTAAVAAQSALGSVDLTLDDGSVARGAGLVVAEGVGSTARRAFGGNITVQPSGYAAYRTVIPSAHAGVLEELVVGAWLSPVAHVVHYPVHGGRDINLVIIVREAWTATGWSHAAEKSEVSRATAGFASALRNALAAAPEWSKWSVAHPIQLPSWNRGSMALLGDAAHAMLPFFAQGGAMALEDAVVIAACLARHPFDTAAAFHAYSRLRGPRVARVQSASAQNGKIFHLAGPLAAARDTVLRLLPPSMQLARLDWLYGHDASKF